MPLNLDTVYIRNVLECIYVQSGAYNWCWDSPFGFYWELLDQNEERADCFQSLRNPVWFTVPTCTMQSEKSPSDIPIGQLQIACLVTLSGIAIVNVFCYLCMVGQCVHALDVVRLWMLVRMCSVYKVHNHYMPSHSLCLYEYVRMSTSHSYIYVCM